MLLSIDPSINVLGYALIKLPNTETPGPATIVTSGTLTVPQNIRQQSTSYRIWYMLERLQKAIIVVTSEHPTDLIIEQPQHRSDTVGKGAMHSKSLDKLMFTTGAILGWGYACFPSITATLIPVTQWKGQLPKEETKRRVMRYWNYEPETLDESDALGLAQYWLIHERTHHG
jgi:hypothetical protein